MLGSDVQIGKIEKELHQLWESDEALSMASLINFAIYSEAEGSLERNSQMVAELTRDHAVRAILIHSATAAPENAAQAWITAHCHLVGGKKSVCSEQIAFALRGEAAGRIRNIVFAHLASDLPLVFWWQGEWSPIFEPRLVSSIDRLLFDSATWADQAAGFARLREVTEGVSKAPILQDLSWTRGHQWRKTVAALFDDEDNRAHLAETQRIEVTCRPDQKVSAYTFAAWIATQLGWEYLGGTGSELRFQSAEAQPRPSIQIRTTEAAETSALSRLRWEAGSHCFILEHLPNSPHLEIRTECGRDSMPTLLPADPETEIDLVGDQLARSGQNRLFLKTLPLVQTILDSLPPAERDR
ncbi:MAG: glucose-6-phosphate dehydrogenase assembly protein OpcA [Verrucomicrobiota bacterium]